jgi:hypothetical protein
MVVTDSCHSMPYIRKEITMYTTPVMQAINVADNATLELSLQIEGNHYGDIVEVYLDAENAIDTSKHTDKAERNMRSLTAKYNQAMRALLLDGKIKLEDCKTWSNKMQELIAYKPRISKAKKPSAIELRWKKADKQIDKARENATPEQVAQIADAIKMIMNK